LVAFAHCIWQGWVSSSLAMGRNGFLQGRKPFFWEETPKGYSKLTMQTDTIFSTPLYKQFNVIPHQPLTR